MLSKHGLVRADIRINRLVTTVCYSIDMLSAISPANQIKLLLVQSWIIFQDITTDNTGISGFDIVFDG